MPVKYLTKGTLIIHKLWPEYNTGIVYNIDYTNQRAKVHWARKDLNSYHPLLDEIGYEIARFYDLPEFKIINNGN